MTSNCLVERLALIETAEVKGLTPTVLVEICGKVIVTVIGQKLVPPL